MTRREYLDELNTHLMSLSSEERENAVKFYEEYFDDAGPENEQEVINELGKPYALAKSIICEQSAYSKSLSYAQYRASRQMNNSDSSRDNGEIDNTPDIMPDMQQEDIKPHTQYTSYNTDEPANDNSYEAYKENYTASGNTNYEKYNTSNNTSSIASMIIAIIFGIPAVFLLICLFACFVMGAGGCFIGAVIVMVISLINLASSFGDAMAGIGTAILLAGMGFLFSVPSVLGFGKTVPALIKSIVKTFKNAGGTQ